MKNVRTKMLAKDLKSIVNLPNYPDNQLVEILTLPVSEEKKSTPEEIDNALKRIDEIMAPVLSNPDFNPNKTLEEYRLERLEKKYGTFN